MPQPVKICLQAMAVEDYEAAAGYVKDFLDLDAQAGPVQDQVEGTQAQEQIRVRLCLDYPACPPAAHVGQVWILLSTSSFHFS